MKWEQDLVRDIRTYTPFDDSDENNGSIPLPLGWTIPSSEVTIENRAALKERFLRIRDNCPAILEIGVNRECNGENTTTGIFLNNKNKDTVYVGIDIDDKSYLNNPDENIWTIQGGSESFNEAFEIFKDLGIEEFGFIFIDGWHSINQVLVEWEYTQMLTTNGIVGWHDTTNHPGPYHFVRALNKDIWEVEENVCPNDYGIGFAWRK